MDNFNFCSPTDFVFGRDTQLQIAKLVLKHGGHNLLLVYGGQSAVKSGLIKTVTDELSARNIKITTLSGIKPNPTDDRVYEGIALARENDVDFVLAVGGGSVIDTAKAIALGVPYGGDFWDFYSGKATPESCLPVGVVLTIPAAGSEGSPNSVITRIDGLHKISYKCLLTRPKFAVLNPELTMSLPWAQTAAGIVDMLCHIFERYFSNTPAQLVNAYSEAIMRVIMARALTLRVMPDDYDARADIMWAGTLAHNGLCGVGKEEDWASHRIEHEVSAIYDVTHGAGLACIVPAWMTFVAEKNPDMIWQFAVNVMSVNPDGKTEKEVMAEGIRTLKDFYHDLGMTTSLRQLISGEPDIDALVRSLEGNMGKYLGNYVTLSMEDCREIYKLAL